MAPGADPEAQPHRTPDLRGESADMAPVRASSSVSDGRSGRSGRGYTLLIQLAVLPWGTGLVDPTALPTPSW